MWPANYVTVEFSKAGVTVEVMTAATPHEDRQTAIRRFEQGITKIIINVGVLVAGLIAMSAASFRASDTVEMRWIQVPWPAACVPRLVKSLPHLRSHRHRA